MVILAFFRRVFAEIIAVVRFFFFFCKNSKEPRDQRTTSPPLPARATSARPPMCLFIRPISCNLIPQGPASPEIYYAGPGKGAPKKNDQGTV